MRNRGLKITSTTINRKLRRHFSKSYKYSLRRKFKKVVIAIGAMILGFTIVTGMFKNKTNDTPVDPKQAYQEDKDYYDVKATYEDNQAKLQLNIKNEEKFIESVSNEISYNCYEEQGKYAVTHNTETSHFLGLYTSDSEEKVYFDYNALIGIDGTDIEVNLEGNVINITYDINKMNVKAIDSSEPVATSDRDWLGHKYTNQEVLTIMNAAKDELTEKFNNDELIRSTADENLKEYFTELAKSFGIENLVINDSDILTSYEYMQPDPITYNVPGTKLEEVKYIVVHSTDVEDRDAWSFYKRLSEGETDRGTSAHAFVDDEFVVQCVPFTDKAYHCGGNNSSGINNDNAIGIEICEYSDTNRQENAIKNAIAFVSKVKKQYPNAKVVMHREVKATECPHILSNEDFEKWFR